MTTAQIPRDPTVAAAQADAAPPSQPGAGPATVARAVFGLVDDQYGVVAHTPNVTRESAHELSRAVSVGDPAVPIEDALSFLEVPGWGFVCTRYATQHDARGRLALVSDSVAVDAASFRALRADPFRCIPRRGDVPNAGRPLDVPRFTASTPAAEAARLADARRDVDEGRELRPLLAAVLAGERVLSVAPAPITPALLQCLVLLLPPRLRTLMTFQTAATRAPARAPRLTASDRRYAELGAVAWTRELPREVGATHPRADAAADALLALPPASLAAAHATYEAVAADAPPADPSALLDEAERVARLGALATALAERAPLDALRAAAGARDDRELDALATTVLGAFPPEASGASIAALLAERGNDAYRAAARLLGELLRREAPAPNGVPPSDQGAAPVLDAVLAGSDGVRWTTDPAARRARAALAVAAARRGDGARLLQLADADAPWAELATSARAAGPGARPTVAVVAALAHAHGGDADAAVAALDAVSALATSLPAPARRDAAALGFAVAAHAATVTAGSTDATAPERLRRVADAVVAFWERVPASEARADAVRRLLGAPEPREADAIARQLDGAAAGERAAWLAAAALRARAAGDGVSTLARVIDAAGADPTIARVLGTLLVAAAAEGPPLHDGWPALLARLEPDARRTLLLRALARTAADPAALDELAATCAALADLDFRLDAAAARDLAPSLGRWASALPATRAAAVRLGAALALLAELADADAAALLAASALGDAPEDLRTLVQLRRLAAAATEVEGTRDPGTWSALRAALLRRADALLPAQLAALRTFLGLHDGRGVLARLRREVTR